MREREPGSDSMEYEGETTTTLQGFGLNFDCLTLEFCVQKVTRWGRTRHMLVSWRSCGDPHGLSTLQPDHCFGFARLLLYGADIGGK
ncbi:Morphogeneis-related protein MSB1 [Fusarium oxysporum f. sp. albedinis]|nr:Morphogeneis-related protein MSB1 [Fusarium oxysporum f. sp. albedinis]